MLTVKGFTTKGDLKQAAKDHSKASIFLEPALDGIHSATPLGKSSWEAMVYIRDGRIVSVK